MTLSYGPGAADKIRAVIREWAIDPTGVAQEIFRHLEQLDENPSLGQHDEDGKYAGAFVFQFRIERLPVVLRATVAYYVFPRGKERTVLIADFQPGFVIEEDAPPP